MDKGKLFEKIAVQLSDAQILELGKQAAEKREAWLKLQGEKSDAVKVFNDKLNALEAEYDELTHQISARQSEREIEVAEEPDDGRKLMIIKEVESGRPLRTRKMTLEEIADSEARLNGIDVNGAAHDTEPPEGDEKPKNRKGRKAAAETNEELGD